MVIPINDKEVEKTVLILPCSMDHWRMTTQLHLPVTDLLTATCDTFFLTDWLLPFNAMTEGHVTL